MIVRVRRALGQSIRSRVAGDDADTRGQQIWGKPGERWFSEGDPIWRVHQDASMFPGGIAALLLQSLHPLAMAAVAGHSGYRGDPWGRLKRTGDYIAVTTFGTVEDAEAMIATVRQVHERVRGRDSRGRAYRASDPHLLLWVHVAEVWAFLAAYRRFGGEPMSPSDADAYVAQAARAGRRLGVLEPPVTVAELDACLESFRPELESSPEALDAARYILRTPPLPLPARPGYLLLASGGTHLLPDWAQRMLTLSSIAPFAVPLGGPLGTLGTSATRWALASLGEKRTAPGSASV